MTKEEAIQIIDSLDPAVMIKTTASNKQIREAIDMAVEALSEPSLPSNLDEAAEEALKKAYPADAYYYVGRTGRRLFKEGYEQAEKDTIERAVNVLVNLPSLVIPSNYIAFFRKKMMEE